MQKMSRREFTKKAAASAAAIAAPAALKAQEKPPTVSDAEVQHVQAQTASPLSTEAKKILRKSLADQKEERAARLKHKLPENSEPCFIFVPTPKREDDLH